MNTITFIQCCGLAKSVWVMALHCIVCFYGRFEGIPASVRNAEEYSLEVYHRRRNVMTFSVQVGLSQRI